MMFKQHNKKSICWQKKSLEQLSPEQKAELIFDPDIGALEDEALVKKVLTSFKGSPDDEEFKDFFKAFAKNNKQVNALLRNVPFFYQKLAFKPAMLQLSWAGDFLQNLKKSPGI